MQDTVVDLFAQAPDFTPVGPVRVREWWADRRQVAIRLTELDEGLVPMSDHIEGGQRQPGAGSNALKQQIFRNAVRSNSLLLVQTLKSQGVFYSAHGLGEATGDLEINLQVYGASSFRRILGTKSGRAASDQEFFDIAMPRDVAASS